MDESSRFEKFKQHLKKYQTIYLCGATGIICVVGTRYAYRSGVEDLAKQIVEKISTPSVINNTVAPVMHNVGNQLENVVDTTINHGGRLCKIVKRVDKFGNVNYWESVEEAAHAVADQYNLKPSSMRRMISRNANGHIDDVYSDVFSFVGTGTR